MQKVSLFFIRLVTFSNENVENQRRSFKLDKNRTLAIIVVAVVITSAVVIAVWYPTTIPDVRIGYLSQDLHQLALRVAMVNGWFLEEGLNVELLVYDNGAYEMTGFQGGQIDMGYLGAAPALVKSINDNIPVTVLAAANLEGSGIAVLKEEYDSGRVTSIEDLVGKTIFQPGPSTVQNFLIRLALNQSGLSTEDVTLEQKRVQDMAISLTSDKPAFIAWEPFPSLSEYENITETLLLSGEIWPRHPCCVVASSNSFLSEHPDTVQTVVGIHKRAEKWIVDNPTEALAIAVDWLQKEEASVELSFNRIIYDYNVNRTGIELYLRFLISEGLVEMESNQVDSYLDGFIDTAFIETDS
jgi:NitT/TauT family transport system substrate-binding protein